MELGNGSGLTIYLQDRNHAGHTALPGETQRADSKNAYQRVCLTRTTARAGGFEEPPQLKININLAAPRRQAF
ncbi:unnamed protein product, partial [Neisseria lactamica Y92-1009]